MTLYTSFPCDLVEKILERLPVKSLVRFKSLSKHCSLLSSDSRFIKSHLKTTSFMKRNRNNFFVYGNSIQTLFAIRIDDEICRSSPTNDLVLQPVPIMSPLKPPCKSILGMAHCDGLLCLFTLCGEGISDLGIVVWNPLTKEQRTLSPIPKGFKGFGFGFNGTIDDYEVVLINRACSDELSDTVVHRLRLKTNSWVASKIKARSNYFISHKMAITFNGSFYWTAFNFSDDSLILCYDMEKEILTSEEVNLYGKQMLGYPKLGVLGGFLCLSTKCCNVALCGEVWKRTGIKSWEKIIRISNAFFEGSFPLNLDIVCFVGDDNILINKNQTIGYFLYDPKDESLK